MEIHREPVGRGQGNEFVNKLEAAGLDSNLAQRVIDSKDNDLAVKVVRLIQNGGFEPTTSQKRAREIMGHNFFGIEEAIKHFGVNPSRQQLVALSEIPYSEATLEELKNSHVLVAIFPLSVLDIRGKMAERSMFYDQSWYNKEAFAKEKGESGWHLVRKTEVPDSTSKNWNEQSALLGKDDEVPTARVMAYTIIGHYLATSEHLFERLYVRTSSVDSGGRRVGLGYFDSSGLDVAYWWDDSRSGYLGLASARKSP